MNHPYPIERMLYLFVLFVAFWSLIMALQTIGTDLDQRWLSTCSSLLGIASIFQLRISGWFERFKETYSDIEKYPWGPPIHITRELIEEGKTPVRTRLKRLIFSNPNMGAGQGLASIFLGLIATWL